MSLTRKLTRPLTRPPAIASGATAESDNVVLSGGYKSFTPTFVGDKSIKFDGTDDRITTSADSTLATKTYSFWAKSTKTTAGGVFDHGDLNHGAFFLHFSNGRPLVYLANGWFRYWDDVSSQDDGTWHHYLVLLHTNINNTKLFVDGVEQSVNETNTSSGSALAYTTGIRIGRGGAFYFDGSLDEFAIFDGDQSALADELYNNGQPKNLSSYSTLDHWYRMGEGKLGTKSDGESNLLFDQGPNGGLSSEKLTNGDFSDASVPDTWNGSAGENLAGWAAYGPGHTANAHVTITNGAARLQSDGTYVAISQSVLSSGASYKYSVDVTDATSGSIQLYGGAVLLATINSTGTYSGYWTSTDNSPFYIKRVSTPTDITFDNISVKEVQNVGTINGPAIQADGGTELVTNGDLSNGTTGWENPSGGAMTSSVVSGKLRLTSSSAYKYVFQSFTTRVGGVYSFTVDATKGTSPNYDAYLGTGQNGATLFNSGSTGASDSQGDTRTITGTFTATSTTTFLNLRSRNEGSVTDAFTEFDNISVKEVTESVPKKTQNLPSAGSKKSLSFDGTDDFAIVPYQLPATTFTVSVWFKITEDALTSASTYIWDARDASYTTANIFLPVKHSATEYKLRWWNDGTHRINNATIYPIGRWQHVVLVKDGTTGTMYVDGEKLDSATSFSNTTNGTEINLGRRYAATFAYLKGGIDEFAAWDTALDGDAIRALYNAGQPTPVTTKTGAYDIYRDNLKAYYKMGGATNPAADGTSNLLFDQTNPGVGAELITNGDYSDASVPDTFNGSSQVNLAGWTSGGSTHTAAAHFVITNGACQMDTDGTNVTISQGTTVVGKAYQYSLEITDYVTGGMTVAAGGVTVQANITSNGTYTGVFVATGTTAIDISRKYGAAAKMTIDNVSVKQVNGNTGTITGATIQTEAPKAIMALPPVDNKLSLNFDGTNDHLVTQVDANPVTNESVYYSWWSKSTRTTHNPVFDHGNGQKGAFHFNQNANRPLLWMASSVYRYWVENTQCDDGTWHHYVLRIKYNDITECDLWCDTVKQAVSTGANTGSMNTYDTGIRIGRGGSTYFEGSIDEFSIHEDLDDEAIRALFNRGRPIDISSGHGAYDQSDKALHWWRMGDAPGGQIGSSGDVLFQGFSEEDSELVTNGDFSNGTTGWTPAGSLQASASDGALLLTHPDAGTWYGNYLPFTSSNLVAGRTYKVTFDAQYVSGTQTLRLAYNSTEVLDLSSGAYDSTSRTYEAVFTATFAGSFRVFINGGTGSFKIDNVSVKQVRGQYIGAEQLTNGDFSSSSNWTLTSSAEITGGVANWPDATNSYIYQNANINLAGIQAYKLEYDVVTTNGSTGLRLDGGSSAFANTLIPSDTVGKKTVYVVSNGSQAYLMFKNSASFVGSIDNVSLKPVGGAAVMTNMTTSDLQLDTPY